MQRKVLSSATGFLLRKYNNESMTIEASGKVFRKDYSLEIKNIQQEDSCGVTVLGGRLNLMAMKMTKFDVGFGGSGGTDRIAINAGSL